MTAEAALALVFVFGGGSAPAPSLPTPTPIIAPEVALPKGATFRAGDYHASHRCPKCKHESAPRSGTWIVRGFNADNTHTHACPNCGTTWRH